MLSFNRIYGNHSRLYSELAKGKTPSLESIQGLIKDSLEYSPKIDRIEEREELRNILRFWGGYLTGRGKDFPDIDIDKPGRAPEQLSVRPYEILDMSEKEKKEITPHLLRYVFPDDWNELQKEAKPITAKEVVEALKDGKAVEIRNAAIEGPLILKSVIVEGEVTIQGTKIRGPADWSHAIFKQVLNLTNCTFETDASFRAATVEKDIFLDNATFRGKATFLDLTVKGFFSSESSIFKKEAVFNRIASEKGIFFEKSTFEGETSFIGVQIQGNAEFTGAVFKQKSSFDSARIEGHAFFRTATFEGQANFMSARIGGNAEFTGAVFKQRSKFNSAPIEGHVFFRTATFEDEADFISVRIGGSAEFTGAVFKQKSSFNSARIEGHVFFRTATFEDEADFIRTGIEGNAEFTGAVFKQRSSFNSARIEGHAFFNPGTFEGEADFIRTRIGSNADFNGAVFKERAYFNSVKIEEDILLQETVFAKDVSFQNTSVRTFFFVLSEAPLLKTQFKEKIDMRGCTYNRIHPISIWKELMERLDPYDRQPFSHLEETFRGAGEDHLANKVYYERKCREASRITIRNQPFDWIGNRFLWLLTGFGVQLKRILAAIALVLLLGTIVFQLEGAVEPRRDIQSPPPVGAQANADGRVGLHSGWDAFWVSLHFFLPVKIPAGADWEPTSKLICSVQTPWGIWGIRCVTIATLLKLAGWILVPVGLAGLSGILKR